MKRKSLRREIGADKRYEGEGKERVCKGERDSEIGCEGRVDRKSLWRRKRRLTEWEESKKERM